MSLADAVVVALAEAFRGDARVLASPMGPVPRLATRLAKATFAPDLVLTDGVATIVDLEERPIGWMPFSRVFDVVWSGRRHVVMGASQLDRHGHQNLSHLGDPAHPKVQLIGPRGAPGNTIHHATSYWIPDHSPRVLVPRVDFACGVGPARGGADLRRVVTNLAVFDAGGPGSTLRLVSVHPGVTVERVREATGFELAIDGHVPTTPGPDAEAAAWLDRLDPGGAIRAEVR